MHPDQLDDYIKDFLRNNLEITITVDSNIGSEGEKRIKVQLLLDGECISTDYASLYV